MKTNGYKVVSDILYGSVTTFAGLNAIKSNCSSQTVLCAGGAAVGSDNLLLVSCGNCLSVLNPTLKNQPVLNNGAYWYFSDLQSFGFSPIYNITQFQADTFDCVGGYSNCPDNTRLSWHLLGHVGGWRLGKLTHLNHDRNYRKIIFLK